MAGSIARNLEMVRQRIASAAHRAGRDPGEITLVGVSKTVGAGRIREAIEAGLKDLGENRVQEAREKIPQLDASTRWHLVGHLQGNKAKHAARLFHVVHSIDSVDILRRLEAAAAQEQRTLDALVQIDLAGEKTKFGLAEADLDELLETAGGCGSVSVTGLMILPPLDPEPEQTRTYFRRLRKILEAAQQRHAGLDLRQLSMGMTEDFEVAIEEGATLVRVGRALFGARTTALRSA